MRYLSALLLLAFTLRAETAFEYWPSATYDAKIPTETTVLGRNPGDRISSPAEILQYAQSLAAAAPTRIKVVKYGETWEHRALIYLVIGSEANMRRLDEIQSAMARLSDPRVTNEATAKTLIANLPAIVWLAYGVHGNEISSPDAALMTAYHLLASQNDKTVDDILANDLVLIDPLQNPDGRDRFVNNFTTSEGLQPDPSQLAAEHNEPWPGGRTNHYFFDMNRDWFAITQPETRGRIAAVRQWMPLVFTDLHEMGSNSTYYFTPEANPYNPYITKVQRESLEWFGLNNAGYFDRNGWSYFTKEGYDEFYPGYGASWPLYYGSIAMTYEQMSTRGLVVRKDDGDLVTYRDTVREHFVASISTAQTAARNREKLLANFYQYRKDAVADGAKGSVREYILIRDGNVSAADKLAANLALQGIEVKRSSATFQNAGKTYPTGSYLIDCAQPSERLIRTLLDPQVSMEPDFLKSEDYRRLTRQPSEMYDVTAWSLPLQYGVTAEPTKELTKGNFDLVPQNYLPEGSVAGGPATVAYLIPWGSSAAGRFLAAGLQAGLRIATNDKGFTQSARTYPSGTLIVKVKENPSNLADTIAALARQSGAEVIATNSSWLDEGPSFGSSRVSYFPSSFKVAMAWDRPTSASSAGATRYVLERQFGFPVTVIRAQQLAGSDLTPYQALILPDGGFGDGYESVLGPNGTRRLKDWVQNGGTLVALGPGAVAYLSDPRTGLLAVSEENAAQPEPPSKPAPPAPNPTPTPRVPGKLFTTEQDFTKAIAPESEPPDSLHGVLLRAKVDPDNWVSAGVPDHVNVLVTGRAIFTPVKLDRGKNVAYYEAPDKLLASGFMWEPNRKQLAFKPFVIQQSEGRGNIVAFTSDPNFRGYMDGLNILFLNSVFRGPGHSSRGAFGAEE